MYIIYSIFKQLSFPNTNSTGNVMQLNTIYKQQYTYGIDSWAITE